jgi:hypothetical protein
MLPKDEGETWSSTYDDIMGVPGRVVAAVAGKEYRSREVADKRLREILSETPGENVQVKAFSNGIQ